MKNKNWAQELANSASTIKRVPVPEQSVTEIYRLLYEKKAKDLWEILRYSREYLEVTIGVVEAMRRKGLLTTKNDRLTLTAKGKKLGKELLGKHRIKNLYKANKPIELMKGSKKILKKIKEIYKEFKPKDVYDQAPLLPESAIEKVSYAIHRGDVTNKAVVCVGDDDFLSLILGLTGMPKEILAIDIDKEVIRVIDVYAKKLKLPVTTLKHDLRLPIPKQYQGRYDTFFTQPPDTVIGFCLFVDRGIELLKRDPGRIGYVGTTPTACPPLGMLDIQRNLTKMGLIIMGHLPQFLIYPAVRTELKQVYVPEYVEYPPKKPWYISDLVRLKTTKLTKPIYKSLAKTKISEYRKDFVVYR